MRNFLAIIGAFALGFIAVSAALFVWGAQRSEPLLTQATAFADDAIPAIATDWNAAAFVARAAPELAALFAQAGSVEQMMSDGRRLVGVMTDYQGAECQMAQHLLSTDQGEIYIADCVAAARHERADADYQLRVLKRQGEWKLLGFFVIPKNSRPGPVQVSLPDGGDYRGGAVQISLRNRTFGVVANPGQAAGARIDGAKIDNDLTTD